MKKQSIFIIVAIFILLISLPYLAGLFAGNSERVFTGLILNPVDGYSYFAKMAQGYQGNWLFQLPFTADPGEPVFLFFFYILLGHISRLLHMQIAIMYHIARLAGTVFLLWQLWRFISENLKLKNISMPWSYLYLLFASGMGWFGLLLGYESGDFVVPEAYPFYSSLINPHFPIGIGIFILLLNEILHKEKKAYGLLLFYSAAFAVIMPFGSVILCVVICLYWLIQDQENKSILLGKILLICIPAALLVGFQYYETITHEKLINWNQQNVTPTPPVWDILLSFSPMIFLAFYSMRKWKENMQGHFHQLMMVWFFICIVMIFIPFGFQRRFMFAFAIPVGLLGLYGFDDMLSIVKFPDRWKKIIFALPAISIVFIILISFFAIMGGSSYSFVTSTEKDLYQWIKLNSKESVILAEPEIAVKIPAYTQNRVYYGHPYETIDADEKMENIETWYACEEEGLNIERQLLDEMIDLVIIDKRQQNGSCFSALQVFYENDDFILYEVNE